MLVFRDGGGRSRCGIIRPALKPTGGDLKTRLRRPEEAGYLETSKAFADTRPRAWISATESGRRARARYPTNLSKALDRPPQD